MSNNDLIIHTRNISGRDFFVGDLHGCYSLFMEALQARRFDPEKDRVFSVGDLIDRGPDSLQCLQLVSEPWFFAVQGNHEQIMWSTVLDHGPPDHWYREGGHWGARTDPEVLYQAAQEAREHMPLAREVDTFHGRIGVIHADVTSGTWRRFDPYADVWSRRRIQQQTNTPVSGIDHVVVGHSIVNRPVRLGNVVLIDTGAFRGGELQVVTSDFLTNP